MSYFKNPELSKFKWELIGLCTSPPKHMRWCEGKDIKLVYLDLLNDTDSKEKISNNADIARATHLFYAAYREQKDEESQIKVNMKMFKNCLENVNSVAKSLEKVVLYTGAKYYGVHLGPYKTPASEDDPRLSVPNFYYNQEDFLKDFQLGKQWTWNVVRPNEIIGYSKGFMNIGVTLAVYATLCKELHLKFKFPGTVKSWEVINDASDSKLIAQMVDWLSTTSNKSVHNEAFNIVNGDLYRWKFLFPKLAEYFGLEVEGPKEGETFKLSEYLKGAEESWEQIVVKYELKHNKLQEITTLGFVELWMGKEYDALEDMNKAREAGWIGWRNTVKSYYQLFDELKELKVIPKQYQGRK